MTFSIQHDLVISSLTLPHLTVFSMENYVSIYTNMSSVIILSMDSRAETGRQKKSCW
jgi:hypothetical protein